MRTRLDTRFSFAKIPWTASLIFVVATAVVLVTNNVSSAQLIESVWDGPVCFTDVSDCRWSDPSNWLPSGIVPNNAPGAEYSAVINSNAVSLDIPVELTEITVNGGSVGLRQPLRVDNATVNGGSIGGELIIDGDLMLRSGSVAFNALPSAFPVGGNIVKNGLGTGILSIAQEDENAYDVLIEQGTLRFRHRPTVSQAGIVRISNPEFARVAPNRTSATIRLQNAHGFNGTGALVSTDSPTIEGDLFLGDQGSTLGFAGTSSSSDVIRIGGSVHGGSMRVAGRGTISITSGGHTYTGLTQIGEHNDDTLMVLNQQGQLLSTSGIVIGGRARLLIGDLEQSDNRISDMAPIFLRGGTLDLQGVFSGDPMTPAAEKLGVINLEQGASRIGLLRQTEGIVISELNRSQFATLSFVRNLGTGYPSSAYFAIENSPSAENEILGGWATINDLDFAAFDTALGVVPLGDRVTRPSQINGAQPTDHIRVASGGLQPLTSNSTVSTITSGRFASNIDLGGHTLTLQQGGLLLPTNDAGNPRVANGQLTAGNGTDPAELFIRVLEEGTSGDVPLEVSASIVDNPTGAKVSLVRSGDADVRFTGENNYSGPTVIQGNERGGRSYFAAEAALPDHSELTIEASSVILEYEPTNVKSLTKLSLKQSSQFVAARDESAMASTIKVDADAYELESGSVFASLAGDGVLRKTTVGSVSLNYESPDFSGDVSVERGTLIATGGSANGPSYSLGTGEVTIHPNGTVVHEAFGNVGFQLNSHFVLAGGSIGLSGASSLESFEFVGDWNVTEPSQLLLFDPLGNRELDYPEVNVLADVSFNDGAALSILGEGAVNFASSVSVSGTAVLDISNSVVELAVLSAIDGGGTLQVAGNGRIDIPNNLSGSPTSPLVLELAEGVNAKTGSNQSTVVMGDALVLVNGGLENSLPLLLDGGVLGGDGQVRGEPIINTRGIVSPGQSIGTLFIESYQQTEDGMAIFEIESTVSDQLIAESVEMAGILLATLDLGESVMPGDAFDLIIANSITSSDLTLQTYGFAGRLDLVTLSEGEFTGMQALRLFVVPEPTCAILAGLSAFSIGCLRKHDR